MHLVRANGLDRLSNPCPLSRRGFGAVVTAVPVASAVYFWGYEFTKQAVGPSAGSTGGVVVGGMVAQAAAGLIYTPMDVIKERQQARSVAGRLGHAALGA